MIRLLIADDEALERETLADIVARRFEHEVTIETAENGRKAADTAVPATSSTATCRCGKRTAKAPSRAADGWW